MKLSLTVVLGVIAGVVNCIAWYTLAQELSYYAVEVYVYRNYITFALLVIGVCLSIFLKRRKDQGLLEFKEALKTGLLYSVVLAFVLALFNYIYYAIITPDTIDYFLSEAKKALMKDPKVNPLDIPKYLEAERTNFSSFKLIPPILFFGLITSLLAGFIMQKKAPSAFSAN